MVGLSRCLSLGLEREIGRTWEAYMSLPPPLEAYCMHIYKSTSRQEDWKLASIEPPNNASTGKWLCLHLDGN